MAIANSNVRPADKRNYQTAKRASLWGRKEGETEEKDFFEFGNIVDPVESLTQQLLEHYSNRRGQRALDRTEIVEQKLELKFSIEEMAIDNLVRAFGGSGDGKSASSVKIREGKTLVNKGAGEYHALKMSAVNEDDVVVRETSQEGTPAIYVAETFATDSGDNTAGGSFNNTTDPISVVAATYPGIPTAEGTLIKIASEYLRVESFSGGNLSLSRGALGSTPAAHVNALDIFIEGVGDYAVDATGGRIYVLPSGDLADETTIGDFSAQWTKTVTTEKFALFDGTVWRGEIQLQILTKKGSRLVATFSSAELRNSGDISFGTGQDWIRIPLTLLVLADDDGSFGEKHVVDGDQEI